MFKQICTESHWISPGLVAAMGEQCTTPNAATQQPCDTPVNKLLQCTYVPSPLLFPYPHTFPFQCRILRCLSPGAMGVMLYESQSAGEDFLYS